MSHVNVVRAWKDEEYRLSLSEAERSRLPENPAGLLEQTEVELESATGGYQIVQTVHGCYYQQQRMITTIQSVACTTQLTVLQGSVQYGSLGGFGG